MRPLRTRSKKSLHKPDVTPCFPILACYHPSGRGCLARVDLAVIETTRASVVRAEFFRFVQFFAGLSVYFARGIPSSGCGGWHSSPSSMSDGLNSPDPRPSVLPIDLPRAAEDDLHFLARHHLPDLAKAVASSIPVTTVDFGTGCFEGNDASGALRLGLFFTTEQRPPISIPQPISPASSFTISDSAGNVTAQVLASDPSHPFRTLPNDSDSLLIVIPAEGLASQVFHLYSLARARRDSWIGTHYIPSSTDPARVESVELVNVKPCRP